MSDYDPERYEAWYETPRGRWVSHRESRLMGDLLLGLPGCTLLDVGCGTGHFSRRFAADGFAVTGIDLDTAALHFARHENGGVRYLRGDMGALPFADRTFDHVAAVTSLCFVTDPARAVAEMWRVSRHSLTLGLLNHDSLLFRASAGRGGYTGARWDRAREVSRWIETLSPSPELVARRTAILLPRGRWWERALERVLPETVPWGGFLLFHLRKT